MTCPLLGAGQMHHRNRVPTMATGCTLSNMCLMNWKRLAFPPQNRNLNLRNGDASLSLKSRKASSLRGHVADQGRLQISLPGFYSPIDWETFITFRNHERSWKQAVKFASSVIICYLVAYGLAKPIVCQFLSEQSVKVQENFAMLSGAGIYTTLNYLGQRYLVFRYTDQ